jgi:hypothetical protein
MVVMIISYAGGNAQAKIEQNADNVYLRLQSVYADGPSDEYHDNKVLHFTDQTAAMSYFMMHVMGKPMPGTKIRVEIERTYHEFCELEVSSIEDARKRISNLTRSDFGEIGSDLHVEVWHDRVEITGEIQPTCPKIAL